MISAIRGRLAKKEDSGILIDVAGISYGVLIPAAILAQLDNAKEGDEVSLVTFHYYATDPSKSIPVLIGFLNEIEKEFFEIFITVSGVGPKAAVKAINKPISEIARAIDAGDLDFLKSLPGIGMQRAKEIVAKLQQRIGKFALMQDTLSVRKAVYNEDIENEALQVLLQLQYKNLEAAAMIRKAMDRRPDIETSEELLNEVYRQRKNR